MIVHLVFCESFSGRHNRYSDRFLLEKRGDRSLALHDISKIFYSQLVTKRRHRYLRKTYLWLFAILLKMSPSQKSRKVSLKPRRRSLLSEKLTIVDQVVIIGLSLDASERISEKLLVVHSKGRRWIFEACRCLMP